MDNPLTVKVNQPVRVFLVNAGPNHISAFHVIGTIFQRVLDDGIRTTSRSADKRWPCRRAAER